MDSSNSDRARTGYIHGKNATGEGAMAARTANIEAAFFLPYLGQGHFLLDGGCGPGSITQGLAEVVAPGEVVGIDYEESVVDQARENAKANGVTNVQFQRASLLELAFDDNTFDAVFTHMVVEHIADSFRAISELFRVLKPGGHYGARHSVSEYFVGYPHAPINDEFIKRRNDIWRDGRGDPNFGLVQSEVMNKAGFEILSLGTSTQHFSGELLKQLMAGYDDYMRPVAKDEDELAAGKAEALKAQENPFNFRVAIAVETVGRKPADA